MQYVTIDSGSGLCRATQWCQAIMCTIFFYWAGDEILPTAKFYERKYEILKTYRVCYDNSINQNISDLKTLSVTNLWSDIKSFSLLPMKKMSSLCVHSDQNAEPWPSREFTEIKKAHRDNLFSHGISTQIRFYMHPLLLHSEITFTIWFKTPSATKTK